MGMEFPVVIVVSIVGIVPIDEYNLIDNRKMSKIWWEERKMAFYTEIMVIADT